MNKQAFYRPCAGAVVFNKNGFVLLGNRLDTNVDAWQFPQGGIEKGETPAEAARRELFEETNVQSVRLICADEKPTRYDFTDEIRLQFKQRGIGCFGQDIYFSLFFFDGSEDEIDVNTACPEFKSYSWQTFDFAVRNIISFKKDVYVSLANRFEPIIRQYLENLS